jgi:hypothetical protein
MTRLEPIALIDHRTEILLAGVAFAAEERDIIDLQYSAHTSEGEIFERPERCFQSQAESHCISSGPS